MKKWFLLCFILLIAFGIYSSEPKICLNMIVKDESCVITRCLQSVKPFIDYWVIVDTGSKDGTQQIIKEFMKDIPGELHEQPWVNFGHNRNEALKLAKGKGTYILFIDADEQLEGTFDKKLLNKDAYLITVLLSKTPLFTFQRAFLINDHLNWSWQGIIHEKVNCSQDISIDLIENIFLSAEAMDGHRSQDPQKHLKDVQTLEKALLDEPNNADYVYYLAQSYYNAREFSLSLKNYQKRALMTGWNPQTYESKYMIGKLEEFLKMNPETFIKSYCEAFHYNPTRAEPLFCLAVYFLNQKNYILGYIIAQFGLKLPKPTDRWYIEDWIYSYGMLTIFADCAAKIGKNEEALIAYEKIAQQSQIPEQLREICLSNCKILKEKEQLPIK